jgi:hypothetical protein
MSSLEAGEALAAEGATAPRVPVSQVHAKVKNVEFANPTFAPHVTVAMAQLVNGFTVIGMSAPASPENFDKAKGQTFAMEDVLRQVWRLEGYLLREKLHGEAIAATTE